VFASLLIVIFIELADQFLENRPHGVVVDASGGQVDVGVEELVDQRADGVGSGQCGELVAELKVIENVLDVGREAVKVVLEICEESCGWLPRDFRSRRVNLEVL